MLIAPLFFVCGVIDWLDGGPDAVALLISGLVIQLVGFFILRFSKFPSTLPLARLFTAFVSGALAALIAATIAHFATGVAPTIDVALAEASATVTGTNRVSWNDAVSISWSMVGRCRNDRRSGSYFASPRCGWFRRRWGSCDSFG